MCFWQNVHVLCESVLPPKTKVAGNEHAELVNGHAEYKKEVQDSFLKMLHCLVLYATSGKLMNYCNIHENAHTCRHTYM